MEKIESIQQLENALNNKRVICYENGREVFPVNWNYGLLRKTVEAGKVFSKPREKVFVPFKNVEETLKAFIDPEVEVVYITEKDNIVVSGFNVDRVYTVHDFIRYSLLSLNYGTMQYKDKLDV